MTAVSSAPAVARSIETRPASCARRRSRALSLRRGPISSISRAVGRLISPEGERKRVYVADQPAVVGERQGDAAVPARPAAGLRSRSSGVWAPAGAATSAASAPMAQPLARRRKEPRLKRPGSRGQADRQDQAAPLARPDETVADRLLDFRRRERALEDGLALCVALDQAQRAARHIGMRRRIVVDDDDRRGIAVGVAADRGRIRPSGSACARGGIDADQHLEIVEHLDRRLPLREGDRRLGHRHIIGFAPVDRAPRPLHAKRLRPPGLDHRLGGKDREVAGRPCDRTPSSLNASDSTRISTGSRSALVFSTVIVRLVPLPTALRSITIGCTVVAGAEEIATALAAATASIVFQMVRMPLSFPVMSARS